MSAPDFGRYSEDYATHRPGFPESFFDRLERHLHLRHQRVLDLGTGPGVLALKMAARGASVVGIDIAANQIDWAKRRAEQLGFSSRCAFHVAPAEKTELPSRAFDLVTAGQCWGWFNHEQALAEVQRVLRPGGLLIVAHYDYLTAYSEVVQATEQLILQHNPAWKMAGHTGLYPHLIDRFGMAAGMRFVEQFCYDVDESFTHESWRGRMRTCNGVGAGVLNDGQVEKFDRQLGQLLKKRFSQQPLKIPHRVWAVVVQRRSE
ncbi:MAG TPA: class I SAM-dependent methyltransferase [Phycisphaerales bacterium]|nr:class I SAM-dependent methyltransferase [Phycisphaerales bacterium]HRQ74334.1 class I SAM-dependent methyltransferase [Phycisphaerales bacterium]